MTLQLLGVGLAAIGIIVFLIGALIVLADVLLITM